MKKSIFINLIRDVFKKLLKFQNIIMLWILFLMKMEILKKYYLIRILIKELDKKKVNLT